MVPSKGKTCVLSREEVAIATPKDAPEGFTMVDVRDLEVGMYVVMPTSWDAHPFLRNRFRLSSREQIGKIRDAGLTEVLVDAAKSFRFMPPEEPPLADASTDRDKRDPEDGPPVVPRALHEAINDPDLPPPEKSRIVRDNALNMMENLFQRPTKKNLREVKEGIAEVVELILTDDETTAFLNKITTYDYYTYSHSVNVGFLSVSLSKILFEGASGHNLYELGAGFFLHDVGKVQISPDIIHKPGRLSEEEMREMRRHPSLGYKILYEARQLTEECKTIVLQHHERIDGKGYPKGLRGREIHPYGRICAIADVYDALTTDRPYRGKMRPFDALNLMKQEMIDHFQPDLFGKFVKLLL